MDDDNKGMRLKVLKIDGYIYGQDGEIVRDNWDYYEKRTEETEAVAEYARAELVKMLDLKFIGEGIRFIEDGENHIIYRKVDFKTPLFPRLFVNFAFGERIVHADGFGYDEEHSIWASIELRAGSDLQDFEYIDVNRDFSYDISKKKWTENVTGYEDKNFGRNING